MSQGIDESGVSEDQAKVFVALHHNMRLMALFLTLVAVFSAGHVVSHFITVGVHTIFQQEALCAILVLYAMLMGISVLTQRAAAAVLKMSENPQGLMNAVQALVRLYKLQVFCSFLGLLLVCFGAMVTMNFVGVP